MNSYQNIKSSSNDFQIEASNCSFDKLQQFDYQYISKHGNHSAFTGKELDSETGYSYFGARYYDSELSGLFFSVDLMADKNPSISPYAYSSWNPVEFVDPDGEEKIISFVNGKRNDKITNAAERYKDNAPVIHLWAHGSPDHITVCGSDGTAKPIYDAKEMTDFLSMASTVFNDNQKVGKYSILVLHSCETGQGDNNIAQKLSQDMNLLVVAPTETVVVHPVYNQIPDGPQYEHGVNKVTRDENGNPDKISTRGGWNIYYKGMLVETFDGHSKPIFNNPEKIIEKYEKIYNERTNQQ